MRSHNDFQTISVYTRQSETVCEGGIRIFMIFLYSFKKFKTGI